MAQCSEDELYQRADNLLRHATQHFQSLFLQKWEHLTQSKWNAKNSVQQLFDILGIHLSRLLLPHQKCQLVQGAVEEWDITLLSRLLIHFNKEENDEADQAIRSITDVRNKLAHNARKKLNFEDYSSTEREVKANLIILGMEEKVIQKIINQAEATSLNSVLEQLKKLQTEGDELFNKKRYDKAIQVYSDAMLLPNLSPGHLSVLYEKRGYCHISISKKNINIKLKKTQWDLAFSDGEKAIKLNIDSWKGHYILAQVYQLRSKLDEAQVHYHRAIAIAPGQPEVKNDLDACTLLAGKMSREEHLDPWHMPMSLSERVKNFNDETNNNISEEDFLKRMKRKNKFFPGEDHVNTGRMHMNGWGVPQNYPEAAKHFAKARKAGIAEGIYNLAELYKDGLGVKQDIPFAIELYLEAANKEETEAGVRAAQCALGLLHEEGVGVTKDFGKAAYWYKKAAEKGCGGAANNLALLYINGQGVPLNDKMAEMYWKIGVTGESIQSAYSLYIYYYMRMEPKLARSYFNTAIELGHDRLKTSKAQVFEEIDKMEKERGKLEGGIKAFEEANKLDTRGLTFVERMKREASSKSPEMAKLVKDIDRVRVGEATVPQVWAGQMKNIDIDELIWKAEEGSKTALNILTCLEYNFRLIEMWNQGQPCNPARIEELINTLYICVTSGKQLMLPKEMHSAVPEFVKKLFQKFGGEKSKLDMKLRLCLFHLHCSVGEIDELQTEILVEALRRYPDEIKLYTSVSTAYANLKEFRKGLEVTIKGLLKAPNDPDLLHCKAGHIRLLNESGRNGEKIREAYKRFIEHAPVDNRMIPEAYYYIGLSYKEEMKRSKEVDELICHYYELGEEAEKVQLSCYLPYESQPKFTLTNLVMTIKNEKKLINGASGKASEVRGMNASANGFAEKTYLQDLKRIQIIKQHRQMAEHVMNLPSNQYVTGLSQVPKLCHKIPKSLTELKAIGLQEMNPTKDQIYEGRILNLTVIEGPFFGLASIPLIAEDDNGEATRLVIYNNDHARQNFGVGAKFAIINPYMRIGLDSGNAIRVDDPKCIIHNEGVKDMCRYCGEKGAKLFCAQCNKAKYCGKHCQEMDWKVLNHKLICLKVNGK